MTCDLDLLKKYLVYAYESMIYVLISKSMCSYKVKYGVYVVVSHFLNIIITIVVVFQETRKEPTQARKYFMIVNLPLFCI